MPQALYVVIYQKANGTQLLRTANKDQVLREMVAEVVDLTKPQLADGGLVAKDGGRVQVFGMDKSEWFRRLLASDVQKT